MAYQSVLVNGVEIAYLEEGPPDGPLALLLHGFPDSARTWRHLLPELAAQGFHAVAPWMRGYAPSAIPEDGAYETGALVSDACGLHQALGGGSDAVIIGHDWGALAAYGAASYEPKRWRKVVAMAVPPPSALMSSFFSYDQLKRSFYIFFFQSPLAETAVSLDRYAFLDRLWEDWSPGYDASEDLAYVKEAIGRTENLQAAIGYYRAMFDPSRHHPAYTAAQAASAGSPSQPTLYLHGATDGCMGREVAGDVLASLPEGSRQHVVEKAGHFLHLEQPTEVNRLVLDFLSEA
jgi:pimeloyl-ACP methyl ester carboxylesterase